MADRKIMNRSALAGVAVPGALGAQTGDPGVRIHEVTDFAAMSIIARRGRVTDVAAVLSRHAGIPVVDASKRAGNGTLSVTGTAPGQWLALCRGSDAAALLDTLRNDLNGLAAATDQGDGRVVLEITGSRARDALAKGISIDLDAIAFKVGDAAQTSTSYIGLQIALIDEAPTFEIISARSTAESLWSWLVASAAEYGIAVA
ncbi:sarcosine oxidase subunit gamma family protein [Hyphomicrobium sp. CS1BSMeth3]|uniref:sarcosine oxidase subunit gamma n=1 Tax=Hyphomicrobium sp. CS1BSMeth3 TaxID=1892844 RepID=UPI0009315F52|nr:sarcosine oxidase subunit gamma family protein [Hyphomicrobium sp. CS1BSMeth3]